MKQITEVYNALVPLIKEIYENISIEVSLLEYKQVNCNTVFGWMCNAVTVPIVSETL